MTIIFDKELIYEIPQVYLKFWTDGHTNSLYEISKQYLKFWIDEWTEAQTSPKQLRSFIKNVTMVHPTKVRIYLNLQIYGWQEFYVSKHVFI